MHPTDIKATALADVLGVDLKTIHNWANAGRLPSYRTIGRHLRFRRADVAAALRAMGNPVPEALEPFARAPLPERVKRVYVAGPSAELQRCERVIATVRDLGIRVTHDWPAALAAGHGDLALAPACLAGVAAADLVLVLAPAGGTTIGAWAEMGAALVLRKPVLLVWREGTPIPFESLCQLARTDGVAIEMLRGRGPGSSKDGEL